MRGQPNAWGCAVDEVLADGRWHRHEDVVSAGMRAVPPGAAHREGERRRRQAHAVVPAERTRGDAGSTVAAGARRLVVDLITSRVRRGTIERDGERIRTARSEEVRR